MDVPGAYILLFLFGLAEDALLVRGLNGGRGAGAKVVKFGGALAILMVVVVEPFIRRAVTTSVAAAAVGVGVRMDCVPTRCGVVNMVGLQRAPETTWCI